MKIAFTTILLSLSLAAFCEGDSLHKMLAGTKGSFYISMSEDQIDAKAIDQNMNPSLEFFSGNFKEVKYLTLTEDLLAAQSVVLASFERQSLELVKLPTNPGVLAFVKRKQGRIIELHLMIPTDDINDNSFTLLSLYGDVTMNA